MYFSSFDLFLRSAIGVRYFPLFVHLYFTFELGTNVNLFLPIGYNRPDYFIKFESLRRDSLSNTNLPILYFTVPKI